MSSLALKAAGPLLRLRACTNPSCILPDSQIDQDTCPVHIICIHTAHWRHFEHAHTHTHRRHHIKLQQTELHAVGINELVQQSLRVQRLLFALLIELHGGYSALEHACGFAVLRSLRLQRQKCGAVCCHSRSLLVCLSMTMQTFQIYMIVFSVVAVSSEFCRHRLLQRLQRSLLQRSLLQRLQT